MKEHRTYIKCLYVYNKIDSISLEHLDKLAREDNTAVMSCELDLGVQDVVERCWDELRTLMPLSLAVPHCWNKGRAQLA